MGDLLDALDDDLSGLDRPGAPLVEATTGKATGIRFVRRAGTGGMAAVFRGVLDGERSSALSDRTNQDVAIKIFLPAAMAQFANVGIPASNVVGREVMALSRVNDHTPPTDYVIGLYGNGLLDVTLRGKVERLPWIVLEFVDGGSLEERVVSAYRTGGIDPIRALRLCARIVEGIRVLHTVGVVHRDLKPQNILVTGPIDDETPKIADCGISRVSNFSTMTVVAFSPPYAGLEQICSVPGEPNPLVGFASDVHALAAVVWFVLAGETWYDIAGGEIPWSRGERPPLQKGGRLHVGFRSNPKLLELLDKVLATGASARLPADVEVKPGSKAAALYARRLPGLAPGPSRYGSVDAFAKALLPLLEAAAEDWKKSAAAQGMRSATVFRATELLRELPSKLVNLAEVTESPAKPVKGTKDRLGAEIPSALPGDVIFRASGRVLGRFGDRLLYFVDGQPHQVTVKPELRDHVAGSRWLSSTPSGGFVLASPTEVLLLEAGRLAPIAKPGKEAIQAVAGSSSTLFVVTAEGDDEEGPELWRSNDATTFRPSLRLDELNGKVTSIAEGPAGVLVAGSSRNGKRGRALVIGLDDRPRIIDGLGEHDALRTAVTGAELEAWAASSTTVVRIHFGTRTAEAEHIELTGTPVVMALDPVGTPWLLTSHAIYRRHLEDAKATWRRYHRHDPDRAAYAGLGFNEGAAFAVDVDGAFTRLTPYDSDRWI